MKHEAREKRVGENAQEQDGQATIERAGGPPPPDRRRFLKTGGRLAALGLATYASPTTTYAANGSTISPESINLLNPSLANPNSVNDLWAQAIAADDIEPGSDLHQILTFYADRLFVDDGMGNPVLDPEFASLIEEMQQPGFDYIAWADSFEQPTPEDPDNLVFPPELLALEVAIDGHEQVPLSAGVPAEGEPISFVVASKTKQQALDCEDDRHDGVMAQADSARAICATACAGLGGGIALFTFGVGVLIGVLCVAACETSYAKAATAEKKRNRDNKRQIKEKYGGC